MAPSFVNVIDEDVKLTVVVSAQGKGSAVPHPALSVIHKTLITLQEKQ